jgi:transcription termination factor NusB
MSTSIEELKELVAELDRAYNGRFWRGVEKKNVFPPRKSKDEQFVAILNGILEKLEEIDNKIKL